MLEMGFGGHCCFRKGASIVACFRPRWRTNLVEDEEFFYGKFGSSGEHYDFLSVVLRSRLGPSSRSNGQLTQISA